MAKRTPSGKFRGKVTIGYDPDGKPIYKYVTAPTRRELENVKEAVREHYIFGRAIPRDQPFYEYAGQWYRIKKEPFISNASRSYYKTCFVKHLLPQFGMQHMKAISAAQIQEFVNGFAGASKSQINNVIGTLKAIFASAYAKGVIERDPTVALIRPRASKGSGAQGADPGGDPARAGDDPHPPGGPVPGDSLLSGRPPGRGAGAQVGRLRLCGRSGPHSPGYRLHRFHLFGGHAQDRRRGPLYSRPGGSEGDASAKAGIGGCLRVPHAVGRAASAGQLQAHVVTADGGLRLRGHGGRSSRAPPARTTSSSRSSPR